METNYIPQRGVDFDDFVGLYGGEGYFHKALGLYNPEMRPIFCNANDKHSDDFIGISLTGFAKSNLGAVKVEKIIYPAKNFTADDLDRLFDKVELENGEAKYRAKSDLVFDEVYIRVCYKTPGKPCPEKDTMKWVAVVDGGEAIVLHGDRRVYQPKDAEE